MIDSYGILMLVNVGKTLIRLNNQRETVTAQTQSASGEHNVDL